MARFCNRPFTGGFICGAALAAAAFIVLANPAAQVRATAQVGTEPQLFITGDAYNATVWRIEAGGTLTCVSHNFCQEPIVAPDRLEPGGQRVPMGPRVPTGPRTPMGPRTPTGPSVPPNE